MGALGLVAAVVAISSIVTALAGHRLRRANWIVSFWSVVLTGLISFAFILTALVIGHLVWLQGRDTIGHSSYSPLAFLIYGFWMVPIILATNLAVSYWIWHRK